MIKILMLTGDAGEAQEIYYAKYRLEEEGWQVDIAAPEKRAFLSVVHDFEPASTPTPRSPATGSRPTSGSTRSTRPATTAWCCPGAGPRSTCGTGRRPSRSSATSSRRASRSRRIATARCW